MRLLDRKILIEYADIREEVKDLRRRINNLERQIEKIEEAGTVRDSVTGGLGGLQHFEVEGFPTPEYNKKRTLLYMRKTLLADKELELMMIMNEVEAFIEAIPSSELRTLFRLYYIDDLTWSMVAMRMNAIYSKKKRSYTDESCRKKHDRFLKKL